jgi:hypothetical protein
MKTPNISEIIPYLGRIEHLCDQIELYGSLTQLERIVLQDVMKTQVN